MPTRRTASFVETSALARPRQRCALPSEPWTTNGRCAWCHALSRACLLWRSRAERLLRPLYAPDACTALRHGGCTAACKRGPSTAPPRLTAALSFVQPRARPTALSPPPTHSTPPQRSHSLRRRRFSQHSTLWCSGAACRPARVWNYSRPSSSGQRCREQSCLPTLPRAMSIFWCVPSVGAPRAALHQCEGWHELTISGEQHSRALFPTAPFLSPARLAPMRFSPTRSGGPISACLWSMRSSASESAKRRR